MLHSSLIGVFVMLLCHGKPKCKCCFFCVFFWISNIARLRRWFARLFSSHSLNRLDWNTPVHKIHLVRLFFLSFLGSSCYEALLDLWFPQSGVPPTAFLSSSDDEAELLSNPQRMRMLRSNIPRLVEAR